MKRKLSLLVGAMLVASLSAQAQGPGTGSSEAQYSARGRAVHEIVLRWAPHVQEAYKISPSTWARGMASTFAKADTTTLELAALAKDFDTMSTVLQGSKSMMKGTASSLAIAPQALGDAAADLVYVPVTPCRLFDTRVAGGAIAANTVRSFDVTAVSDYAFQGGSASNCNGVGAAGSFAAAIINFTVVTPTGAGYITAFPFGGTQPLASSLNYTAGAVVGNEVVVKLDQGASANEVSVYTFAQTHLVGDIVGYFINPAPTALECVEVDGTPLNLAAGAAGNAFAGTCTAGYTAVETQCRPSIFGMRVAGSWSSHCNMVNDSASAGTVTATQRCCRVPGR